MTKRKPAKMTTSLMYVAYSPYQKNGHKWNGKDRILLKSIDYILPNGELLVVPKGYITDLGSVPSFLRGLVDDSDESFPAFIVHDYLWQKDCPQQLNRIETNQVMSDIMIQMKQSWWRRTKTRLGVALGRVAVPYHHSNIRLDVPYANKVIRDLARLTEA